MILDGWLSEMIKAIYGGTITIPTHIAVGIGTTAAVGSDTALETEIFPDGANRKTITTKTKPSPKTVRLQTLIAAGEANGHKLTEIGVSNAASGGTFMNRVVHTEIDKDASFELKVQVLTELSDV